jgi:hypothetical protein
MASAFPEAEAFLFVIMSKTPVSEFSILKYF